MAARLQSCVDDAGAIARLGGDEFAILQSGVRGPDDPRALARRMIDSFGQPFEASGEEVHTSASIGITMFPSDGQNADRLLKNAELAMYRAKSNGRNGSCFFAPQMNLVARRTGLLEHELRQGFAADQFTVHYQPQRDLQTGCIVAVEALLRWRHPRRGMVRPTEFIGLAEDIGLIGPLTERVLERACRQQGVWQRAGMTGLRLSVNLSPVQFREGGVVQLIERTLAETGFDPHHLEIELTEGVMLESSDAAMASLRRLRKCGIGFSLDDFGTGYSSLAYVKRLPVQRLKIDQSFVHRLGLDGQDEAIVRAVIDLGHSLDLKVTAEGVESAEQLRRLQELGCDEAQGDLISPPLPAEAFHAVFASPGLPASRPLRAGVIPPGPHPSAVTAALLARSPQRQPSRSSERRPSLRAPMVMPGERTRQLIEADAATGAGTAAAVVAAACASQGPARHRARADPGARRRSVSRSSPA